MVMGGKMSLGREDGAGIATGCVKVSRDTLRVRD